ncbi:MAG: hypothetical protein DSM107014_12900 [Gomphosphaeria aponina SAG 52.96 = DSM 107014]|uniref:Uncharacterized protein n=1 Tax=Gomphosphaeria aponina SAG 52.96 = DSM 107014 TaxID=1521640 RepID=A0A941JQB2_9CHRO|nr:hypothetical protein [Gomphosphaeria aponina SAG 52.96 = DSM 107014]
MSANNHIFLQKPSVTELINGYCRVNVNKAIIAKLNLVNKPTSKKDILIRKILLHQKSDTMQITMTRLLLFYFNFMDIFELPEGAEIAQIYGIPLDSLQESVRFIPQIKIRFKEPEKEAKAEARRAREAELSIRVSSTIATELKDNSMTQLLPLAQKVANAFKDIKYEKGYSKYHYRDIDKNYKFSIFVVKESDAKDIIGAALSINNDTPNFDQHLIHPSIGRNFKVAEKDKLFGQIIDLPYERTKANMEFYRAELHIRGIEPIRLVNNSKKPAGAIVELKVEEKSNLSS